MRPSFPPDQVRTRLGIGVDVYLILLTAGGGGFPGIRDFYQMILDALTIAVPRLSKYLIVLGPAYTATPPTANQLNIQVWHDLPWMPELIAASNLVICQVGYNTLAEVERAGVPAVVIPAERVVDDQFSRAREAAQFI